MIVPGSDWLEHSKDGTQVAVPAAWNLMSMYLSTCRLMLQVITMLASLNSDPTLRTFP